MDEYEARADERDRTLVRALCDVSRSVRIALAEWMQEELKDQRLSAQLIQETWTGLIQTKAKEYEEIIDELDRQRLPNAIQQQKARLEEIYREFNEDPFDDYMYLEESTFRLERMARMVFRMRQSVNVTCPPKTGPGIMSVLWG